MLILSDTAFDQSGGRKVAFSLADWPGCGKRWLTFRLLSLPLWLGVFHVDGFTGVVVVFIPEGETDLGKKLPGVFKTVVVGVWEKTALVGRILTCFSLG